jgi:hypothetical protein
MSQLCSICIHPDREAIDQELISGTPVRDIAGRYGIGKSSINRHKKHIPGALVKAQEAGDVVRGDTLLKQVRELHQRAQGITSKAEQSGDLKTALQGIREVRGCLELLGRVMGELSAVQTAVQVNIGSPSITSCPEWSTVIRVLDKHPEIRQEMVEALQNIRAIKEGKS